MNKGTAIALGAGAVLILGLLSFLGGNLGGNEGTVPRLQGAPTVHVVDKESGQTRTLSIEDYIKGVVAGEMGQLPSEVDSEDDWPHEAYAAQAILARSFALDFLNSEGRIDISTDVEEAQAYAPEKITPAIEQAVEETRGVVMAHNGKYVKAWFHSYSGGHTATAKEGLNYQHAEPGFVRARDVGDNEYAPDDVKHWTAVIPLSQVAAGLAERGVNVGTIERVEVAEWGQTGRAVLINVIGSAGTEQVHAADFRIAAGSEVLKSTKLHTLEVRGGQLHATGTGYGHGVGLSQWDAYKMAREGRSAREILEFFFKDITIGEAWS